MSEVAVFDTLRYRIEVDQYGAWLQQRPRKLGLLSRSPIAVIIGLTLVNQQSHLLIGTAANTRYTSSTVTQKGHYAAT